MAHNNLASPTSLLYYGDVLASAQAGASTQDTWASLRNMAEALGHDTVRASVPDVSRLRTYANSEIAAQRNLTSAGDVERLRGEMIGLPPYARSAQERATSPVYMARFLHSTADESGLVIDTWRTMKFGNAQMSIGELRDRIENAAQALADKYGLMHVDWSQLSVNEL